jgi:hypothetical protein
MNNTVLSRSVYACGTALRVGVVLVIFYLPAVAQVTLKIPVLDAGDSICITYNVEVESPFPNGVGQVTSQDTLYIFQPMLELPSSDPDSFPAMFKPTGTLICNPLAGSLSVGVSEICSGDSIFVTLAGNQTAPEYTQVFLVVDPDNGDVISIQSDPYINFDQPGMFRLYSYNYLTGSSVNTMPSNLSDIDCEAAGACCDTALGMFIITVNGATAGIISADQTICEGDVPATLTGTEGMAVGALSYQWQMSTASVNGPYSDIPMATMKDYSPGTLSATTYYRRIDISTFNSFDCADTSNIVTISINMVAAGTIGDDQIICSGDTPEELTVTGEMGSGTITYQWQVSTTGCQGTFGDIMGAESDTYAPPALSDSMYYRLIVTSTVDVVMCKDTSNCVSIIVNDIIAGTIGTDEVVCQGTDPEGIIQTNPAMASGTLTHQWQMSTDGCDGTFTDIMNATSEDYDPPVLNTTTYFRRIDFSTVDSKMCSDTANCVTIAVNEISAGTIGADGLICAGEVPAMLTSVMDASGSSSPSYQWQMSTNGCDGTFTDIMNATASTYQPGALAQTTHYRRIAISTVDMLECRDTSNCVTITVRSINIESVMQECQSSMLYDLRICISFANPGPSEMFNVKIGMLDFGPYDYTDLDMNGCLVIMDAGFNPTNGETFDVIVSDADQINGKFCADTTSFMEGPCFQCPEIGSLMSPATLCSADQFDLTASGLQYMAGSENAETDFGIEFVAFAGGVPADPYSGGISLGVVPFANLTMSNTVAILSNVNASLLGAPDMYTICAILSPAPSLDMTCRPFQSQSVKLDAIPVIEGIISGPSVVCPDLENLPYSIQDISNATDYQWAFNNATGTISGDGNPMVTISFSSLFNGGQLSVTASNSCGVSDPVILELEKASDVFCELTSCLAVNQNLTVDNTLLNAMGAPDVYRAINNLNSDATIEALRTVIFRAGNSITLNPPFNVEPGATFIAEIEACVYSIQRD